MNKLFKRLRTSKIFVGVCSIFVVVSGFATGGLLTPSVQSPVTMQGFLPAEAQAVDIIGAINQTKATNAATTGPTTCTGTNYTTGGTVTQPAAGTGDRRYCYGMYSCNTNVAGSCTNPVTGQQMTPGQTCRVGMYETGSGGLTQRALPLQVADCARQGVEWRFTQPEGGHRMANVGAYIDRNGCYTEYRSQASGIGDAKTVCVSMSGSSGSGYSSSVLGPGYLGPASEASGGQAGSVLGWIESAANNRVTGWAIPTTNVNQSAKIRLYVRPQGSTTLNFIGEYSANATREDLASLLGLPSGSSNLHGFDITLPGNAKEGDTVLVYGVSSAGWNPLLGERVIGSASTPTPSSFQGAAAGGLGNSTAVIAGSTATDNSGCSGHGGVKSKYGFLNGEVTVCADGVKSYYGVGPRTWSELVAFCNEFPAQVCLATPQDGGPNCAVSGRGQTAEMTENCKNRVEACGTGREGPKTGFCDPGKITECRETGDPTLVDWAQRVDVEACSEYLWNHGCSADPGGCRPECILPGGERPSDCPAGGGGNPPPSGNICSPGACDDGNACTLDACVRNPGTGQPTGECQHIPTSGSGCPDPTTGNPPPSGTPPPPRDGCWDSRGMPIRCEDSPPSTLISPPEDGVPPPTETFGPAPRR